MSKAVPTLNVSGSVRVMQCKSMVTLGNGSGTDFEASPQTCIADTDTRCEYTLNKENYNIIYEYEEEWQKGILGNDCPDKLRKNVLFLLGTNALLHAF